MVKRIVIVIITLMLFAFIGTVPTMAADTKYQKAEKALRSKFKRLDDFMKQNRYGNARWEESLRGIFQNTAQAINGFAKKWPKANVKPMWGGLKKRLDEVKQKSKAAADKAKAKQQAAKDAKAKKAAAKKAADKKAAAKKAADKKAAAKKAADKKAVAAKKKKELSTKPPAAQVKYSFDKSEKKAIKSLPGAMTTFAATDGVYGYIKLKANLERSVKKLGQKRLEYVTAEVFVVETADKIGTIHCGKECVKYYKRKNNIPFEIIPYPDHYAQLYDQEKKFSKDPKNYNAKMDIIHDIQRRFYPVSFLEKLSKKIAGYKPGIYTFQVNLLQGGFAKEPYLATGRFKLALDASSSKKYLKLSSTLKELISFYGKKQPDVDYSKIKVVAVLTSKPHIDKDGKNVASVSASGNVLYYMTGKMGAFKGDELYSGISYRGKRHINSYTGSNGKTIRVEEEGFRDKFIVTSSGETIATLVSTGEKDFTLDTRKGHFKYTLFHKGKKWAMVNFVTEFGASAEILNLMIVLFHKTDFFH
jgi:hypothetical protein